MGKIRQWFINWLDKRIEKSIQKHADKLFFKDSDEK